MFIPDLLSHHAGDNDAPRRPLRWDSHPTGQAIEKNDPSRWTSYRRSVLPFQKTTLEPVNSSRRSIQ